MEDVDETLDTATTSGWCLQWINMDLFNADEISYKNFLWMEAGAVE